MADELIDICDEFNNLTGIQKMKSEAHRDGLWHRVAHIWIYNSRGEILIQLRAKGKPLYPDRWDISAAGHVSAGEEPIISAFRELEEEIGLRTEKEDLVFFVIKKVAATYKDLTNNEFYYVYFLKFDEDIEKLKLLDGEVQEIKFVSFEEIKEGVRKNPDKYAPKEDYWLEVIGEVEKRLKIQKT